MCAALTENGKQITCRPCQSAQSLQGCSWLLSAVERIASQGEQVTMPQIEKACGWQILTTWSSEESERALSLAERKGVISVDRHMQPWILKAKVAAAEAWRLIYSDMI